MNPRPTRPGEREGGSGGGPQCELCGILHVTGPFARPCHYDGLRRALGDLEPTRREDQFLRWVARFDADTAAALCSLFQRIRGTKGAR